MKTNFLKLAACALFAAAVVTLPASSRAQDVTTNKPAATKPGKTLPFRGTVSEIDTNAMTLTVASRTFAITSETRIYKDGKPAELSEGAIGESVTGSYKTGDDGKLDAVTVRFSTKATPKKKEMTTGN